MVRAAISTTSTVSSAQYQAEELVVAPSAQTALAAAAMTALTMVSPRA